VSEQLPAAGWTAVSDGVHVTLGLPYLRTSPHHGTGFDIAGTGKADPRSTMAALRLALGARHKTGLP